MIIPIDVLDPYLKLDSKDNGQSFADALHNYGLPSTAAAANTLYGMTDIGHNLAEPVGNMSRHWSSTMVVVKAAKSDQRGHWQDQTPIAG